MCIVCYIFKLTNYLYVHILYIPWEPTTFILKGYNPWFGGVKPSFFMVLGSKHIYIYYIYINKYLYIYILSFLLFCFYVSSIISCIEPFLGYLSRDHLDSTLAVRHRFDILQG